MNSFNAYVKVNSANINWYKEYYITKSGLYGYHIKGTDGSATCVTEDKQSGGMVFDTSVHKKATD